MKQNLLPITSKDPLKIASYLTENVTPLYAFIYATAVCIESLYKKMLELGFERQPSSEEMLALMFDSVKFGYFDIHKALSLVSDIEREKRKAIKYIKEKDKMNYADRDSLEFEVPHLMIFIVRFMLLQNYNGEPYSNVRYSVDHIDELVGAVVPTWHISISNEYRTSNLIDAMYTAVAIAKSTSTENIHPSTKMQQKNYEKSSSEMFKMFKSAINSAKKFATE